MEFGVLGAMRVVLGTGPVPVPASRLRVLLAALLWRADRPVSVDELTELVWDDAPPGGPSAAVRALIMRLRRVLGPEAGGRIITRAPGYLIEISGDELDTLRFETLTLDAGAAGRASRWGEAAGLAAEALRLWRGAPLADVSSQLLRDRWVPRLEELRLQALESRIEAGLQQGRHEELVTELRDAVGWHPLRERFHHQLMLALARAGRQAEALAAYQDTRRILVSDLGIEPGPELRLLHERILAGDADILMTPARAALTAEASQPVLHAMPPAQLPAAPRSLTGRQAELGMLDRLVQEAAAGAGGAGAVLVWAVNGMPGVGKATLAVHAAHRLAGDFPDGQLFIDMHGYAEEGRPRTAGEALGWFLRGLGVPPRDVPTDTEERAAVYRQRLAGTKTLVVLDNVASEKQVRPLLPGSSGSLVLITSRRRLKGLDDAHVLTLDVLPRKDSVALLRSAAGSRGIAADDPTLAQIADLCGRLPLALRIAAALLRHRPAWTPEYMADLLRDPQHRIRALSDGERDLSSAFDLSYRSLPEPQQRIFRYLGLIPGPDVDACATAALAGTDTTTAATCWKI